MDGQPRRPRRLVSRRTTKLLRLLGYRYSFTREAWVHRIGNGRFGPAFTEIDELDVSGLPQELIGQLDEQLRDPSSVRMAPSDDRPITSFPAARRPGDRLIPVRWEDDEEETTVFVDGRPPLRGGDELPTWSPPPTERKAPPSTPNDVDRTERAAAPMLPRRTTSLHRRPASAAG